MIDEITKRASEIYKYLEAARQELNTIENKKAELLIENNRLASENKKFIEYEDKAMKVLKAKEESLLSREEFIKQRENLHPSNSSLLPNRD